MNTKVKNIIKKIIYVLLFILMIIAFILLSQKYTKKEETSETINTYYSKITSKKFEVIKASQVKKLLKEGKNIIIIGNSESENSKKYIALIQETIESVILDKIYYYDLKNDKQQQNSNYYDIRDSLNGYLVKTDSGDNNLLAPSLYIVDNGQVKYYNIEGVATKSSDKVEEYWTYEKEQKFKDEIYTAIEQYYLN